MLAIHRHLLRNSFKSFPSSHEYYIYRITFYIFKADERKTTTLTNDTNKDAHGIPATAGWQMIFEREIIQLEGQ